jgi:hypothetical protein
MQVLLIFSCMNLKKLASWKRKNGLLSPIFLRLRLVVSNPLQLTEKPHLAPA